MAVADAAEAASRAQHVRVVYGEGEAAYFNLDCRTRHLAAAIIATCCAGRPGVTVDVASEKGRLYDIMGRPPEERATELLKARATLLLFEVTSPRPGSAAPLPSRPASGRPASGRRPGSSQSKGHGGGDALAGEDGGLCYTPLVDAEYLGERYPGLELLLPGGGRVSVGAAAARGAKGRRTSKATKK